jgi:hypothetical protein
MGGKPKQPETPPVYQAAPPITSTNAEVIAAQDEARRQAAKRRGFRSGLLGMGSWAPAVESKQPKSLLGG